MVQGHGSSFPKAILVADYARGEDLSTNYAISGYSRKLLEQFAKNTDTDFNYLYTTLLIKDPLPANFGSPEDLEAQLKGKAPGRQKHLRKVRNTKATDIEQGLQINRQLAPAYGPLFKEEVKVLEPNLIVPLGEASFQYLTGLKNIRKFRGSILSPLDLFGFKENTKILPILGPYPYLFQDYKQKFISQLDFGKIPKWWHDGPTPDNTNRIWIAKTYQQLRNYVERSYRDCEEKTLEKGGYLVFDIETYMNIPTCISLCFDGQESCCIPWIDESIEPMQRALMLSYVAKVLDSPIPKVNQNIKFDVKTLERWGFRVTNIVGDTMLATSTLYCEFPKNVGFLTSIYTDIPYFKDEGKQFDPSRERSKDTFYLYNAKDSLATHQIFSKQLVEIKELGTTYVYNSLIKLLPIYRRMEDRGVKIDQEQRSKLIEKYESLYNLSTDYLRSLINRDDFNPLSSLQANHLIFTELEFAKIKGVKGTDEESLNLLLCFSRAREENKTILRELINCRKIHKVLEVLYLDIYPDGRFRWEANLAGTVTGRTSFSQTTDYFIKEVRSPSGKQKIKKVNLGHSGQTIGKHGFYIDGQLLGTDIRSMFVPSSGYSFVEIDLSGAEARVDRVLANNLDLTVFDKPGIHKLTGSWIFNKPPDEIKKGTHEYHISKTVRHAGERRMGPNRLFSMIQNDGLGLTLQFSDCKNILDTFHKNDPEIRRTFHKSIEDAIKQTRSLVCPNGRRQDFFNRIDYDTINEGISFLPQAIVSDQTKFSFIETFETCPWAHLLVEAHDGSLAEVPKGREEEYASIYKANIEKPIDFRQGSIVRDYLLSIPAEVSVGETWDSLEALEV
jgi:hypothetical protein